MRDPHRQLYRYAVIARALANLLQNWPVVLIAAFLISPVGPHLRWGYEYITVQGHGTVARCTYLGSRGFVMPRHVAGCPVLAWLDSRENAR